MEVWTVYLLLPLSFICEIAVSDPLNYRPNYVQYDTGRTANENLDHNHDSLFKWNHFDSPTKQTQKENDNGIILSAINKALKRLKANSNYVYNIRKGDLSLKTDYFISKRGKYIKHAIAKRSSGIGSSANEHPPTNLQGDSQDGTNANNEIQHVANANNEIQHVANSQNNNQQATNSQTDNHHVPNAQISNHNAAHLHPNGQDAMNSQNPDNNDAINSNNDNNDATNSNNDNNDAINSNNDNNDATNSNNDNNDATNSNNDSNEATNSNNDNQHAVNVQTDIQFVPNVHRSNQQETNAHGDNHPPTNVQTDDQHNLPNSEGDSQHPTDVPNANQQSTSLQSNIQQTTSHAENQQGPNFNRNQESVTFLENNSHYNGISDPTSVTASTPDPSLDQSQMPGEGTPRVISARAPLDETTPESAISDSLPTSVDRFGEGSNGQIVSPTDESDGGTSSDNSRRDGLSNEVINEEGVDPTEEQILDNTITNDIDAIADQERNEGDPQEEESLPRDGQYNPPDGGTGGDNVPFSGNTHILNHDNTDNIDNDGDIPIVSHGQTDNDTHSETSEQNNNSPSINHIVNGYKSTIKTETNESVEINATRSFRREASTTSLHPSLHPSIHLSVSTLPTTSGASLSSTTVQLPVLSSSDILISRSLLDQSVVTTTEDSVAPSSTTNVRATLNSFTVPSPETAHQTSATAPSGNNSNVGRVTLSTSPSSNSISPVVAEQVTFNASNTTSPNDGSSTSGTPSHIPITVSRGLINANFSTSLSHAAIDEYGDVDTNNEMKTTIKLPTEGQNQTTPTNNASNTSHQTRPSTANAMRPFNINRTESLINSQHRVLLHVIPHAGNDTTPPTVRPPVSPAIRNRSTSTSTLRAPTPMTPMFISSSPLPSSSRSSSSSSSSPSPPSSSSTTSTSSSTSSSASSSTSSTSRSPPSSTSSSSSSSSSSTTSASSSSPATRQATSSTTVNRIEIDTYPTTRAPVYRESTSGEGTTDALTKQTAPSLAPISTDEELVKDDTTTTAVSFGSTLVPSEDTSGSTTSGSPVTPLHNRDKSSTAPTNEKHSPFVELKLSMSWPDFCDQEMSIRIELVELLQTEGGQEEISVDQIQVMNKNDEYCVAVTIASNQEIQVQLYLMNKTHHYDRDLTLVCARLLNTEFQSGGGTLIEEKLLAVYLRHGFPPPPKTFPGKKSTAEEDSGGSFFSDPGVTIALVIAVVGGCCCVGLIILQAMVRRRQRGMNNRNNNSNNNSNNNTNNNRSFSITSADAIQLYSVSKSNSGVINLGLNLMEPLDPTHPLNLTQLSQFCADDHKIYYEYQKLPNRLPRLSVVPNGEEEKNRYANILPLAHTRVKLNKEERRNSQSSYINANYVTGPNSECQYYIATQAPTTKTIQDFWTMVWQQDVQAIVMLTQLEEDGQSKSAAYWPELTGKSAAQRHGDFLVELKQKDVHQEYISSKLEINNLRKIETRRIHHYWYTCWPTRRTPEPISLVKFVLDTRPRYENSGKPLLVHCSPGTGRTGTFIGLDLCMRQFESRRTVDVMKTIYDMRMERAGSVQNKEQYALLYNAVNEYASIVASPVVSVASSASTLHALLPD